MNNDQKKIETVFYLERNFPDPYSVFSEIKEIDLNSDCVFVIDTNVLLLPYDNSKIGAKHMEEIKNILNKLKNANRLYLPERVCREFASNHGNKIASIIKTLNDNNSRMVFPEIEFPKILQTHELFSDLISEKDDLKKKLTAYKKKYQSLVGDIKEWNGNDPIKAIYNDLFKKENIMPCPENEETLIKEWDVRLLTKRPPGYKDASKDDTGIGDFIIWKTIIGLAKSLNKDVVFITGEQKNDWFVRCEKEALFLRPELINEFAKETNGKLISLKKFDTMLSHFEASDNLISEVIDAEQEINKLLTPSGTNTVNKKTIGFDYSQNNGYITVGDDRKNVKIRICFSKASDESIRIYSDGLNCIGRVKSSSPGQDLIIKNYDTTSRSYSINKGEAFFAIDNSGNILSGRIKNIKDDSRNNDTYDYVEFDYEIYLPYEHPSIC